MRTRRHGILRAAMLLLGAPLAGAVGGCDPCAGIANCDTSPRVSLQGRIVEAANGAGSPGVRVHVIRTDGTARDSVVARTNAQGVYEAAFTAGGTSDAEISVIVESADAEYRVDGVTVPVTSRRGEAHLIEPWVRRPFFPYYGELWLRTNLAQRVTATPVEFVRTGGVRLAGAGVEGDGRVVVTSDASGRFALLGRDVTADGLDTLVGTLTLLLPDRRSPVREYRMAPTHLYRGSNPVVVLLAGPHFPYRGETRIAGVAAPGVEGSFRRLGGAGGQPATFEFRSDATGWFDLREFVPTGAGDVTFELTFRPPGRDPWTTVVTAPVLERDSWGESLGVFHVDLRVRSPSLLAPSVGQ